MPLSVGDTFYLQARPDKPAHWCFVVGIDPERNKLYIVNMSEWIPTKEQTCIIEIGEHEKVTKKSTIEYRYGDSLNLTIIEEDIQKGQIKTSSPASPVLLNKILVGIKKTIFLDGKIKQRLKTLYPSIFQ